VWSSATPRTNLARAVIFVLNSADEEVKLSSMVGWSKGNFDESDPRTGTRPHGDILLVGACPALTSSPNLAILGPPGPAAFGNAIFPRHAARAPLDPLRKHILTWA